MNSAKARLTASGMGTVPGMNPNPVITRKSAAVAIAAVGLIHLALAGEYLEEAPYIGVLFIAGGIGAGYVAFRLWSARDLAAWSLGGLISAGMFVGFILSRTVGLPSFHEEEWEASGILSLLLEAFYLGAMAWWLRSQERRTRAAREAVPRSFGRLVTD